MNLVVPSSLKANNTLLIRVVYGVSFLLDALHTHHHALLSLQLAILRGLNISAADHYIFYEI